VRVLDDGTKPISFKSCCVLTKKTRPAVAAKHDIVPPQTALFWCEVLAISFWFRA
jgi:hypothetical protein